MQFGSSPAPPPPHPSQGTFGTVLKCRNRESGEVVAVKKFKSRIDGEGEDAAAVRKTALREVKLLRELRHQNIVTLLDVFRQGGKLYLCFEYLEKTGGVGLVGWGREVGAALGLVSPTGSPARPSWRVLGACVCSPSA